jgi:hypothetical protein
MAVEVLYWPRARGCMNSSVQRQHRFKKTAVAILRHQTKFCAKYRHESEPTRGNEIVAVLLLQSIYLSKVRTLRADDTWRMFRVTTSANG